MRVLHVFSHYFLSLMAFIVDIRIITITILSSDY
jgi:hypothetical protein